MGADVCVERSEEDAESGAKGGVGGARTGGNGEFVLLSGGKGGEDGRRRSNMPFIESSSTSLLLSSSCAVILVLRVVDEGKCIGKVDKSRGGDARPVMGEPGCKMRRQTAERG